jgi:P-type Cu+ transporter
MATDPVCGMYVDPRTATLKLVRENRTYYFCAEACLESFAQPEAHRARLARQLAVAWPLALVVVVLTYTTPVAHWGWVALVAAAVVQGYAGAPFYRGLWDAIRSRTGNMDLLIAVATTAAFGYSVVVVVVPGLLPPALYFDASSLILALILTGNYLEIRTRERSTAVLRALRELLPAEAVRVRGAIEERVSLDALSEGDRLRVRPHERVPSDGVVRLGRSWTDESLVTGESGPVPKAPGDRLVGGSRNGDGLLEMEVTAVGGSSFLGEVGRLVTEAEANRMPLRRLADRVAELFAPTILLVALVAAVAWGIVGHAPLGTCVLIFVTVAITACPCAFGIATPAAIAVGAGRAAEAGILFRGEETIERLARADRVLADKTGTLTIGRPRVERVVPETGTSEVELLRIAGALARGSDHPFARAVSTELGRRGIVAGMASELRSLPGIGIDGIVDGQATFFGRPEGAESLGPALSEKIRGSDAQGQSVSAVRWGGRWIGALTFADEIAPGTADAVRELAALGVSVELVTGDRRAAADRVATALGITAVHAGLSPADKAALVRQRKSESHVVAFVGDGVNDAAALTEADVGIAIGTGTNVAREAGGVLLLRADFSGVPSAVRIARATVGKVRQNLVWAFGYNAVLLPIAAGALVPWLGLGVYGVLPVVGALAMAFSSTSVVANSLSLRRLRLGPALRALTPGSPAE